MNQCILFTLVAVALLATIILQANIHLLEAHLYIQLDQTHEMYLCIDTRTFIISANLCTLVAVALQITFKLFKANLLETRGLY
jgi:hypothetical protein